MGNGLRLRIFQNDGHNPKLKKENHIMKNRKNILTYVVATVATFVISASSSLGVPPLQPPQNYSGRLTHGEFVSCEGQILNPPAYSVGGTWVLNIDMMRQPQVPPPAHLTMVVFRDGSNYLVFPHVELTPVSLQDGDVHLHLRISGNGDARYEYDSRDVLLARRIRRQLYPPELRVANLLRTSQQLEPRMVSASHLASFRCDA